MKKLFAILFAFTLASALVGCNNDPITHPNDTSENSAETGYPSGQVQQEMLMYGGRVFIHDDMGFDKPLPDGWELVGNVQTVDNENIPSEDFAACHLTKDQEIYANPTEGDIIYVKYSKGYGAFKTDADKADSTLEVTASVKDVTRTGLTLVLTGPGKSCDAEITTGSQFHLERYTDGQWVKLETLVPEDELAWTAIAYLIPCNDDPTISDDVEIETLWSYIYGTLEDGKYRVVKAVNEFRGVGDTTAHTLYAEFVIDSATK